MLFDSLLPPPATAPFWVDWILKVAPWLLPIMMGGVVGGWLRSPFAGALAWVGLASMLYVMGLTNYGGFILQAVLAVLWFTVVVRVRPDARPEVEDELPPPPARERERMDDPHDPWK